MERICSSRCGSREVDCLEGLCLLRAIAVQRNHKSSVWLKNSTVVRWLYGRFLLPASDTKVVSSYYITRYLLLAYLCSGCITSNPNETILHRTRFKNVGHRWIIPNLPFEASRAASGQPGSISTVVLTFRLPARNGSRIPG